MKLDSEVTLLKTFLRNDYYKEIMRKYNEQTLDKDFFVNAGMSFFNQN